MLELLIKLLQATLQANGPYQKVYSLASLVTEDAGEKVYPAVYCTKDNYQTFTNEENYVYFRQNGRVRRVESTRENVNACNDMVMVTYPLLCVAYVPKDIYDSDNNFADDKVSQNLANFIQLTDLTVLYTALKADLLKIEVADIETDREVIWKREYKGIPMSARHSHVLCSIAFNIILHISEACLENFDCSLVDVTINGTTIDVSISDTNAWHKGGDNVGPNATLGTKNLFTLPIITNNIQRWIFGTDGHFVPALDDTYDIGSVTESVRDIYTTTIYAANIISPDIHNPVTIGVPASGLAIDGNQVLTLQVATSLITGALSNTDWSNFNTAYNLRHNAVTIAVPANGLAVDANQVLSIALAGGAQNGVVSTGAQTFAGAKTVTSAFTYNEGSAKAVLRQWTTDPTYTAIYLGNVVPAATNYTFIVSPTLTQLFLNSTQEINFLISNMLQARLTTGGLIIGGGTINAAAKLQIDSTNRGFLPPRMTTVQKNAIAAPTAGLIVYDTTLAKLCVYTTAWETITSV